MSQLGRHIPGSVRQRLTLALDRELRDGESVKWQGMQLARIESSSFGIYLFAIPWTVFAVFWMIMASVGAKTADEVDVGWFVWAFPAFGIPFVLVGLAMMATPFVPLFQRGRVLYVVTDQRVLKLSLGRDLDVESVPAERVGILERSESRDGTGTIKIATKIGRDSDGDAQTEHFKLGRVADVMNAFRALGELSKT